MNAMQWTVKQIENYNTRTKLIEQLLTTADPGTFTDLNQLSLSELEELASIMDLGDSIMTITLFDLRSAIDDMYCQLDKDKIDTWEIDGMDILIDGKLYTLNIKELV